jgi:hypothetical protein
MCHSNSHFDDIPCGFQLHRDDDVATLDLGVFFFRLRFILNSTLSGAGGDLVFSRAGFDNLLNDCRTPLPRQGRAKSPSPMIRVVPSHPEVYTRHQIPKKLKSPRPRLEHDGQQTDEEWEPLWSDNTLDLTTGRRPTLALRG